MTNCCIAVKHGDTFKAVLVEHDGHPNLAGKILHRHYLSPHANQLVALGDVKVLKRKFKPADTEHHSVTRPAKDVTIFKGRDLNHAGTGYTVHHTFEELTEFFDCCKYIYVMERDQWKISTNNSKLVPLESVLYKD